MKATGMGSQKAMVSWMLVLVLCLFVMQAVTLGIVIGVLPPPLVGAAAPFQIEDVNQDGLVNVLDVQAVVNAFLAGEGE